MSRRAAAVYVGQFLNNAFHGEGTIKFPGSGSYDATWTRGVASDGRYTFDDGECARPRVCAPCSRSEPRP